MAATLDHSGFLFIALASSVHRLSQVLARASHSHNYIASFLLRGRERERMAMCQQSSALNVLNQHRQKQETMLILLLSLLP